MRRTSSRLAFFGCGEGVYALSLHAAVSAGYQTLDRYLSKDNETFFRLGPRDPLDLVAQKMNQLDGQGFAALHYALQILIHESAVGNDQQAGFARGMVRLLITHGARYSAGAHTCLMYAVNHNLPAADLSLLLRAKDPESLVPVVAGIDKQDPQNGRSALHYAAARGNLASVRLLLLSNARSDLQSADGKTAYQIAVERGFTDLVQCFEVIEKYQVIYAVEMQRLNGARSQAIQAAESNHGPTKKPLSHALAKKLGQIQQEYLIECDLLRQYCRAHIGMELNSIPPRLSHNPVLPSPVGAPTPVANDPENQSQQRGFSF